MTMTMTMSIVHRITGGALYFGMLLVVWWLLAAAAGANGYARFQWFTSTIIGRLLILGFAWALVHHLLGGIRHLIWDLGYGFDPAEREWLARANLIGSIALTILLCIFGYMFVGRAA
jgi:succinate dehydrogenase / fumarate reductase cytochrome b subunit